ncbi:MAG: hypothetical protein H5T39_00650 [Methanobacteriales archaeon]|nr:hypothetical protein [Methanobacteriaceae archaeon]MBC7096195.1 hypothetical protein [Methanobacteriales archaeon]
MPAKPEIWRVLLTIFVTLGWLLFLALWLFFYATNFNLTQNIGVFIASIVVFVAIIVLLWVPWSMKHAR